METLVIKNPGKMMTNIVSNPNLRWKICSCKLPVICGPSELSG